MDWNYIFTSIISLVVGGGITALVTIRYSKIKARAEAEQSLAEADSSKLDNVKEILQMYKQSFADMQELHQKREDELNQKYEELSSKFDSYKTETESKIKSLNSEVEKLRRENSELRSTMISNCGTCKFYDSCLKIKSIQK